MILEQKTLKYKGQIVFEKISMDKFDRIPKLYQNNEACFMFVNEGEFSVRTPNEYSSFKKGKALLAKCFDYFFEVNKQQISASDKIEVVGILLHASIVEELFQFDVKKSTYSVDFNTKQIEVNHLLNGFKDSINILLENPELADEELIKTKLKEFIILISKSINAPSHLDFLSAMFKVNSTEFNLTIKNNTYANLSIEELAFLCSMSVSSFKRKFKETFNESPKKYILKMKLLKAAGTIAETDVRISEIAYDCGFDTISTFNRAFKSHFGKSPSDYRLSQTAQSLN